MNNDWKKYLQDNGGTFDSNGLSIIDESPSSFPDTTGTDIICDLSCFDTIVVAGDDAAEFMQGQFTNDVMQVDDDHSQLSGFCNSKGRMIANFRLFQHQQNYFISIRNDLTERSLSHLQNYILRAQVAIQDISEQLVHLGVSGDNTSNLLSPFIAELNDEVDSISHNEDYIAIRVAGSPVRYEIFCSPDKAVGLWQQISQQARAVNSSYWDYLNIVNGLPMIDSRTSEAFVPQMANMELINGVSFEKGCYTGQEIVARTHYLGKQKRRSYHLKIYCETAPEPGAALATGTSSENQYTGTLVVVVETGEGTYHALAVVQIAAAESGDLILKDQPSEITIEPLPYSLEST